MLQYHVVTGTCHLVETVVEEHVTDQRKGIALAHADIAKGIKRVGGLVIERAVAEHERALVVETHIAHQELCRRVDALVEVEAVGVQEMDARVGGFAVTALVPRRPHGHGKKKGS